MKGRNLGIILSLELKSGCHIAQQYTHAHKHTYSHVPNSVLPPSFSMDIHMFMCIHAYILYIFIYIYCMHVLFVCIFTHVYIHIKCVCILAYN